MQVTKKVGKRVPLIAWIALASAAATVGSTVWAQGGMESGGGDRRRIEDGAAWFLGDRVVRVCAEVAPDFGVDAAFAKQKVLAALDKWQRYLREREVNASAKEGNEILLNYRFSPVCDGTEELTFYLGGKSVEIEKAKESYSDPLAFAHRREFDVFKRWGRGFIWLEAAGGRNMTPLWKQEGRLEGMLLHEIGHVLGCDHIQGTIMDEEIVSILGMGRYLPPGTEAYPITEIDGPNLLVTPRARGNEIVEFDGELAPGAFEKLAGRAPVGEVHAQFRYARKGMAELRISDATQTFTLPMDTENLEGRDFSLGGAVFRRAWGKQAQDGGMEQNASASVPKGTILFTSWTSPAKSPLGEPSMVTLELNTGRERLAIRIVEGIKRVPIFFGRGAPRVVRSER